MKMIKSKTLIKHDRIFIELIASKDKLLDSVHEVRECLKLQRLPKITRWIDYTKDDPLNGWQKAVDANNVAIKDKDDYLKTLAKADQDYLYGSVYTMLEKYELGPQWFAPILIFTITGYFLPPLFNFVLDSDPVRHTVTIKLNHDTSIQDLKEVWSVIHSAQVRILGKHKSKNVTDDKKWIKNLRLYTDAKMMKEEDHTGDLTDTDIAGRIYKNVKDESVVADRKRANNLRQIKHRMGK